MKLDVGCGSRKKEDHLGLDIRRSARDVEVIASATDLPFRDNVFSVVHSRRVIQHIKDDVKAFSEIHRVLEKTGEAQIILASWRGWLYYKLKWLFKKKPYAIFHLYRSESIQRKNREAGLWTRSIVKIKTRRQLGYDFYVRSSKVRGQDLS